jgi:exopolysaccharide biosynthesis polyprenyl glycosylphosphotransferase
MAGKLETREPTLKKTGHGEREGRVATSYPVPPRLSGWQLAIKRAIDIIVALLLLPILIPLSVLTGIAIKVDSVGPVFYNHTRIGKDGVPFTMYKFRSMRKDAERLQKSLDSLNEAAGPVFKIRNDPRITRVGAILRKTSLDELPQIFNVLHGVMSLVGPRPPLPDEVEKYNDYQFGRLAVKPGITCLWQVQGRSNLPFDKWVELDLEYIRTQSLWLDFKILLKTVVVVIRGAGAW